MIHRLIEKHVLLFVIVAATAVTAAITAQTTTRPATTGPASRPATGPASRASQGDSADAGKMTGVKFLRRDDGGLEAVLDGLEAVLDGDASAEAGQSAIAHMRLSGPVSSAPPEFSLFGDSDSQPTLRQWLGRLAKARKDGRIAAVAIEIDSPSMSWSQAQELADAVRRLNAVKPVCTHVVSSGPVAYLVASAGSEVTMDPAGTLGIVGIGAEMMFFRGALDWLGIQPQFIHIGRFKGAAEPMMRTGPSEDALSEMNSILDDLYDQLCVQIARQRKLTIPHVKYVIDNGPLDAEAALKYRLVDKLVSRVDWREHVAEKFRAKEPQAEWINNYASPSRPTLDASNPWALLGVLLGDGDRPIRTPTIAIVHAEGMIVSGAGGGGLFGQRSIGDISMERIFREIAADDRIKAVVLRIDSPGGGALASERIYQAVRKCAEKKPVIASILGTGASGGYYIALGAREIIANPAAITGSIGVVSGKLAITGLLEKLRIGTYEITRGKNAGLHMSRPWTPDEQQAIQRLAQRTYDLFARRVSESRAGKVRNVDEVAQGRVFTARQAVKNGLIDSLGGLREAIAMAQKAAGVGKSHFITFPRPRTLGDLLFSGEVDAVAPGALSAALGRDAQVRIPYADLLQRLTKSGTGVIYLLNLAGCLDRETVLTAMPYWLSIRY